MKKTNLLTLIFFVLLAVANDYAKEAPLDLELQRQFEPETQDLPVVRLL